MPAETYWEHFPHEADIGVRGVAPDLESAFEQAALAMMAVVTDLDTVACTTPVRIHCEAPDTELLLTDWLNALVYEMAIRNFVFGRFQVSFERQTLDATAWGEAIDPDRHPRVVEVKGATYTDLKVYRNEAGLWVAQCIVDV